MIGIDRIRDVAEKIVIIAVHRLTVNGNAVTILENGIPHTRIGKNIFHVRNQIPQVALPGGGNRSVLPYDSHQLAHRDGCAHPVNQICQKLFSLCSLEHKRFIVHKCFKVSEALKTDFFGLCGSDRCAQMPQCLSDSVRCCGLQEIIAGIEAKSIKRIFRITGHKNDIDIPPDIFELPCKLKSGHSAHLYIQKGDLAAVFADKIPRFLGIPKSMHPCLCNRFFY